MICMSLDMTWFVYKKERPIHPFQQKQMESFLTKADNLELWLRRINMRHRRETKKLTLLDQIILSFKLGALYSVK